MNVKSILNEQFQDLISEETLNVIEEAFNKAVDEKAQSKIEIETENVKLKLDEHYTGKLQTVIEKIDEDHTAKLSKLVEAIDTDHAVKLQGLVKQIDKKHTGMLKQVVEKYETELGDKATEFQNRIVEEVSNYMDLYLDKTVPTEQLSEAVENIKAVKQLEKIRQIVGISEEFIDSEIKEALIDGKKTIDSLRAELNKTLKENVDLSQKATKAEAHIILEQKTSDMPVAQKNFVTKLLKNKAPEYIEENFSYVVDMFNKESQEELDVIKESVKKEFVKAPTIDRPEIVEEARKFSNEVERSVASDDISGYLNEMKKISGSRFTR
jgi:hypothetical protein